MIKVWFLFVSIKSLRNFLRLVKSALKAIIFKCLTLRYTKKHQKLLFKLIFNVLSRKTPFMPVISTFFFHQKEKTNLVFF